MRNNRENEQPDYLKLVGDPNIQIRYELTKEEIHSILRFTHNSINNLINEVVDSHVCGAFSTEERLKYLPKFLVDHLREYLENGKYE